MSTLYGWHSKSQEEHYRKIRESGGMTLLYDLGNGIFREEVHNPLPLWYSTPGGGRVLVTEVTPSPDAPSPRGFDDYVFMGEVTQYIEPQCAP